VDLTLTLREYMRKIYEIVIETLCMSRIFGNVTI